MIRRAKPDVKSLIPIICVIKTFICFEIIEVRGRKMRAVWNFDIPQKFYIFYKCRRYKVIAGLFAEHMTFCFLEIIVMKSCR